MVRKLKFSWTVPTDEFGFGDEDSKAYQEYETMFFDTEEIGIFSELKTKGQLFKFQHEPIDENGKAYVFRALSDFPWLTDENHLFVMSDKSWKALVGAGYVNKRNRWEEIKYPNSLVRQSKLPKDLK